MSPYSVPALTHRGGSGAACRGAGPRPDSRAIGVPRSRSGADTSRPAVCWPAASGRPSPRAAPPGGASVPAAGVAPAWSRYLHSKFNAESWQSPRHFPARRRRFAAGWRSIPRRPISAPLGVTSALGRRPAGGRRPISAERRRRRRSAELSVRNEPGDSEG